MCVSDLILEFKREKLRKMLERKPVTIPDKWKNINETIITKLSKEMKENTFCKRPLSLFKSIENERVIRIGRGQYLDSYIGNRGKSFNVMTDATFFETVSGIYIYNHRRDKVFILKEQKTRGDVGVVQASIKLSAPIKMRKLTTHTESRI